MTAVLFCLLSVVVVGNFVSTTNLILDNTGIDESKYTKLISYNEDSFTIKDCYLLDRVEQIEAIKMATKNKNVGRTINNMEAELVFHQRMYKLGILKNHSKDATIEYDEDNRWYVRTCVLIYQLIGI